MNLNFETERLSLNVLTATPENASRVLDFFCSNREIFERYEPERPANFYTMAYQHACLSCDYNLTLELKSVRFWVSLKENPELLIGTVCFHDIIHSAFESCETGYKFDQRYWNCGYAKEAMTHGISVMFGSLGLHRIIARVMPENLPSIRLLESTGFVLEGLCHKNIRIRGVWEDHLLYALIRQ